MRSRIMSRTMFAAGVMGVVCSSVSEVLASGLIPPPSIVPEISPASISTALGLLSAGVLIIRARMRRK